MSAVGHSITWRRPLSVKQVDMHGATAFVVSGLMHDPHEIYFMDKFMFLFWSLN